MRKKRFDPSYLEPKDGDFAGFVEKLNQKSVAELKALQVNDELMREQVNEELNGAASGVWSVSPPYCCCLLFSFRAGCSSISEANSTRW